MKPDDLTQIRLLDLVVDVGSFFLLKWRKRLEEAGHYAVATQMKKQGIPLEIALQILFLRPKAPK